MCNLCKTTFLKKREPSRAPMYEEYDQHSLFTVNPKISILVKTRFLETYYLSNSFLQSQARKCSCSHSLRLYMFHCLDTGFDNNHQCLKKKKDMVRIDGNKISIFTRTTYLYKIHFSHGYSTREILQELILLKLKMVTA